MFDFLTVLIFILPAYIANASPVLLGGGAPIDFGKNFFDGKRIFGDNKTIRGFFAGLFTGLLTGNLLAIFCPIVPSFQFMLSAFFLSLGTMFGDLVGSFIKRRIGSKPGSYAIFDSFLFILFALLFAYPFLPEWIYSIPSLLFIFLFSFLLHILSNFIANKLGWKNVPW